MNNMNSAYVGAVPIGRMIHLVNQHKDRLLSAHLSPIDITPAQFKVLAVIEVEGIYSPVEISKALSIDCGSMTRMVERLVKKSLIEKQPNPNDKRGVLLSLTTLGVEILEQCLEIIATHVGPKLTGDLNSEEIDQLLGLLTRMLTS
ncbi:MarR family transcriptional regulator [Vibrio sp. S17_S38]|uniref:MarR family transcriptional regulator n=1 Tax=Vibrio sp. S17_S38 TaxID=2720229 RepID=UPI001680B3F6|nr:MarR family transcriptional regulator [Vibrio sp. S17_S38]MBD1574473.1 MarR family transcriptional regulator [Vibrio sp. S17_S38]